MPIDRTNTDFRRLEDKVGEALTRKDIDRFGDFLREEMGKLSKMQETQGRTLSDTVMEVRELKQRQSIDAGSFQRQKDRTIKFQEANDRRLKAIEDQQARAKYLLAGATAVATFVGAILVKALDYWLAHR